MKLNWGLGIAIFYLVFMTVLLYFVFKSTTFDNSLVMDNYYEQDLNYQQHYEKMANQMALTETLVVSQNQQAGYLRFQFPNNMQQVEGEILLFRPATRHHDMTQAIDLDNKNSMLIRTGNLPKGKWIIKTDWEANGVPYYKETEIVLL